MEKKNQSWFEKRRAIAKQADTKPASQHYKGAMISAIITTIFYAILVILLPEALMFWAICIIGVWAAYFALVKLDSYIGDVIGIFLGYMFGKLLFFYSVWCMVRRYRHNKYLQNQEQA